MQLSSAYTACGAPAAGALRAGRAGRRCFGARHVASAAAGTPSAQQLQQEQAPPLPRDVDTMVAQAAAAVQRAQAVGKGRRVIVELLNAVNEKAASFMSTEAMDYPCSNMKEFETIVGEAKAMLRCLLGGDAQLTTTRIDEGGIDGDLCATVRGGRVMAMVWPTAEKLKLIKGLAQDSSIELLLIVNPLWKTEGNLVSELGIGPWRKANEEFLATFERAYYHYEQRIGAPSSVDVATGTRYVNGAVLRVLRAFPGPWVAHVVAADGTSQAIGGFDDDKPSYKQLEALVESARRAKLEIFALARKASSLDREQGASPAEVAQLGAGEAAFLSPEEVTAMDPKQLRRVLVGLGLPGAGTPQKLLQRAKAVAEAAAGGASLADAVEVARRLR